MTQDIHKHNHDDHGHDHGEHDYDHAGHGHGNTEHSHDHGGHSHDHTGHDHAEHSHDHGGGHSHDHDHDHTGHTHDHGEHSHDHSDHDHSAHNHSHGSADKKRVKIKIKNIPGMIRIERNIHDEAIVISGELTVNAGDVDINAIVASELENASADVTRLDGIVGHIKASVSVKKTGMVSVTEEKAMIKEAQGAVVRIQIAAIVFLIEPLAAEEAVRKALSGMRKRLSS